MEQSPSGDSCRQVSTANFSSSLDCGENTAGQGKKVPMNEVTQSTGESKWDSLERLYTKHAMPMTLYSGNGRKVDILRIARTTYRNWRNVENDQEQHSPARFHWQSRHGDQPPSETVAKQVNDIPSAFARGFTLSLSTGRRTFCLAKK